MEALTQKQILGMDKEQRKEKLDYFENLACNTDYVVYPLLSDLIQRNISLLESKMLYNEY